MSLKNFINKAKSVESAMVSGKQSGKPANKAKRTAKPAKSDQASEIAELKALVASLIEEKKSEAKSGKHGANTTKRSKAQNSGKQSPRSERRVSLQSSARTTKRNEANERSADRAVIPSESNHELASKIGILVSSYANGSESIGVQFYRNEELSERTKSAVFANDAQTLRAKLEAMLDTLDCSEFAE